MKLLLALLALAAGTALAEEAPLYATFETSAGKIGVKLLPEKAPKAVKNFVSLAEGKQEWSDPATGEKRKAPLYDGTLFHRVIPGFMIQGGDPLTRGKPNDGTAGPGYGTGGPGYTFADELKRSERPFDKPCQLAMANHGPNTNGSQFFITEVPTAHLNPTPCDSAVGVCGYVRFGEGVCGCERVGEIARKGNDTVRLEKVVISRKAPTCK